MSSSEISKKVLKDAVKGALIAGTVSAGTGGSVGLSSGGTITGPGGIGASQGALKGAIQGAVDGVVSGGVGTALLSAGIRGLKEAQKLKSGTAKSMLLSLSAISTLGGVSTLSNAGSSAVRKAFLGAQRDMHKRASLLKKMDTLKKATRG